MMNDIAISRLRTILNVSGPIPTVGMRKKNSICVLGYIFHLSPYTLVLCGDSHFSSLFFFFFLTVTFLQKSRMPVHVPWYQETLSFQAEETILQMFNLFLLYPRKKSAYTRFLIKEIVRFRLSFLLIYLPSLLAEWIPWKDYFGKYSYWLAVDKHPQSISYITFATPTSLHRCQFMQHDVLIFSF